MATCTRVYSPANPWPPAKLPPGPGAILAALHFSDPRGESLDGLSDAEWRSAVEFADRAHLTLPLRNAMGGRLPEWLRERTDQDAIKNRQRLRVAEELYRTLDNRLRGEDIEYLALKGLTQCPQFGSPAERRVQYDIDLYVPPESVQRAAGAMAALGFEGLKEIEHLPTDHLPAFIRKTGWQWRGDFFDPEIPLAVELHYRFWNEPTERLRVPDVEAFWERRTTRRIAGFEMPVMCKADGLGYAALHLVRHLLRGSARPFHVYEIARFLELHAGEDAFWREWGKLHSAELRRLEAVTFRLALEWFGCRMNGAAEEAVAQLPAKTRAWFELFAMSPIQAAFRPQKDELWLHLSLLEPVRDKLAIARRRLFPVNRPGPVHAVHVPESQWTWRQRVMRSVRYWMYAVSRLSHHVRALAPAARSGWKWWRKGNRLFRPDTASD